MAGTDFTTTITGTVTGFDVSPITNMNNALRSVPAAASTATQAGNSLNTSLNQVTTTSRATGSQFQATGSLASAFGNNINTARASSQQMVGTNSALGTSFGSVAQGGLSASNTLIPLNTNLQQTAQQSKTTEGSTVSLGEKIGLMAGFVTTTIGSIGGLIEGFTGLEAAQVAADRAQQRVNVSALAAQKAQDAYSLAVKKFGPDSLQAQEAMTNLTNKQEANRIAQDRAEVTQNRLNESYLNFGLEVITVAGELAQMGSTVSILVGKIGLKTAATIADTESNTANAISADAAAVSLEAEGAASATAGDGMGAAALEGSGLTAELIAIAAPAIAAVALFALIETNTFGMGDAFRSITPFIGQFVQDVVNGLTQVFNAFVELANGLESFKAQASNVFVGVHDAIANFFNQSINDANTFQQQFNNALKEIYNFIITQVINNIITAWNAFMKGLVTATNTTFDSVLNVIKTAMSGVLTVVEGVVSGINSALHVMGQHQLDDFENQLKGAQTELKNTGNGAKDAGHVIDTSFGAISTIKPLQLDVRNLNTETIPLINTYQNVGAASHTWDSLLKPLNTTIGQTVTNTLNFASKGENLASVFNTNVKPAISGVIKNVGDFAAGLFNSGAATDQNTDKTTKFTGALGTAAKAQKDFTTQLTDSITKENQQSQAMLQSINTGQQYQKTLADLGKAYADVAVKLADNTIKLTDATAVQQRHSTAVLEGTNKALEFGIKLQDDAASTEAYNKALDQATGFSQTFGNALPPTTKNLEELAKAISGDGEAAQKLVKDFIDASNGVGTAMDSLVGDVSKAFEDIGKAVTDNDALAKIPAALEKVLSPEALDLIALQGRWKAVTDQLVKGFSAEFLAAGSTFHGAGLENIQRYLDGFASLPAAQAPQIQDFISGLKGAFAIASTQSEAAGKLTIEKFLAGVEAQGGGAAAAAEKLAEQMGMGPEVAQIVAQNAAAAGRAIPGGIAPGVAQVPGLIQKNIIDPFTGLPSTTGAVVQKIITGFNQLGTAFDAFPAYFLSVFTRSFVTSLIGPLAKATTSIKGWINSTEVAFSGMVTSINAILAGIKPPTIAGPTLPTGPTVGPAAPPPIKIPAPDLTLFEAGLAKMQTDATNAFAAIINLARVQFGQLGTAINTAVAGTAVAWTALQTAAATAFTRIITASAQVAAGINAAFARGAQDAAGSMNALVASINTSIGTITAAIQGVIPAAFNTAFVKGANDAAGSVNLLAATVQTDIANMSTAVNAIAIVFNTAFVKGANDAAGSVNLLAVTVQTDMANMAAAINAIAVVINTAFNQGAQDAAGIMNQLAINVETNITTMAAAINTIPVVMTAAFNQGAQNAAGSMNELAKNVETNIQNMIAATNAFAIAITSNYGKGAQNAAGSMNELAKNTETNIQNQIAATNAFAVAITHNFGQGASNAAGSMNSLTSNVTTNVNSMISRLNNVITEFNNIRSSIQNAQSAVNSLISAINNIPTSKTVNVSIIEHITQVVTTRFVGLLSTGAAAAAASGTLPNTTNTSLTTASRPTILSTAPGKSKTIRLEISEPTIVKIDSRELVKQINKKLLELDIGALA